MAVPLRLFAGDADCSRAAPSHAAGVRGRVTACIRMSVIVMRPPCLLQSLKDQFEQFAQRNVTFIRHLLP